VEARGAQRTPGALPPSILDIFPKDLLVSRSRVRPIDIRRVEHDNFIEYEIDFVEMADEPSEGESENLVTSHYRKSEGAGDALLSGRVDMESFVELLQRARVRHRGKASTERWVSTPPPEGPFWRLGHLMRGRVDT
jgi:hypothetical protein